MAVVYVTPHLRVWTLTKTFKDADLLVAYTVSAVVQVQQVDTFHNCAL